MGRRHKCGKRNEEFFTPLKSPKRGELEPSKVDHNPKVNNMLKPTAFYIF
jgi:hypothetical protein